MSDLTLRRTILDELEFLPHIDAGAIGVTIDNGVVVLSGHVKASPKNRGRARSQERQRRQSSG